jgi:hypothetical protein
MGLLREQLEDLLFCNEQEAAAVCQASKNQGKGHDRTGLQDGAAGLHSRAV